LEELYFAVGASMLRLLRTEFDRNCITYKWQIIYLFSQMKTSQKHRAFDV